MIKGLQAIPGIGSLLRHNHDPQKIVNEAAFRLASYQPALDFVSSKGWEVMKNEYIGVINQLRQTNEQLSIEARKNAPEIERIAGVIQAAEIFVGLSERVIRAHEDALKTIEHQSRATGRAF